MARARNNKASKSKSSAASTEVAAVDNTEMNEAAEMAALEAALNGDVEVEIDDADFSDVDEDALAAALVADEAKTKVEAKTKTKTDAGEDKKEVVAAPKTKATPNATRDADLFAKEVASILGEGTVLDTEEGVLEETVLMDLMRDVTQIKVREKVLNLCHHVMSGRKLNGYTEIASKVLVAAMLDGCKPVTIGDLKAAYEAAGYKAGTVNAQAGQLMALFRQMGMAKQGARGVLEPNANSVILDALASS